MDRRMKDHGTGHVGDGMYSTLCHTILVVGICATELEPLLRYLDVAYKGVCLEGTTVSQVLLDHNTTFKCNVLKILHCPDGLNC